MVNHPAIVITKRRHCEELIRQTNLMTCRRRSNLLPENVIAGTITTSKKIVIVCDEAIPFGTRSLREDARLCAQLSTKQSHFVAIE
jgi:hypothetical protein